MLNEKSLKAAMVKQGYTQETLAGALGISPSALYRKLHEKTEFTHKEINAIFQLLKLTDAERDEIFFS